MRARLREIERERAYEKERIGKGKQEKCSKIIFCALKPEARTKISALSMIICKLLITMAENRKGKRSINQSNNRVTFEKRLKNVIRGRIVGKWRQVPSSSKLGCSG